MKSSMLTVVPLALAAGVMATISNESTTNKHAGAAEAVKSSQDSASAPVDLRKVQYISE